MQVDLSEFLILKIQTMNRDFKGVWIPKEVWLNKDLTMMQKLFLVEIDSLDNSNGCFASNKYFSEFFGISKGRCTQIIKELELKNYIKITLEYEGKSVKKRVVNILTRVVNKLNRGSEYSKQGYLENDEDNNTVINNTVVVVEKEKKSTSTLKKLEPYTSNLSPEEKQEIKDSSLIDINDLYERYKTDERLKKAVCNSLKINRKQLQKAVEMFNKSLESSGIFAKSWLDYTSHFLNWVRIDANMSRIKKTTKGGEINPYAGLPGFENLPGYKTHKGYEPLT